MNRPAQPPLPAAPASPGPRRPQAAVLRYDSGSDPAPKVVAKGYGAVAETIIRTAQENGVHVHQSRELVDLLMRVDLDAHIPPALYVAVAELLAWLYRVENEAATAVPAKPGGGGPPAAS
ncbi:MAG: EscU/YscU/HrcU family type III secretion system export apparatus switch protein [Comamonas sp.]